MRERPIIFSGEMVNAILDGRKTQTRRVMKDQPDDDGVVDCHSTTGNAYVGNSTSGGIRTRVACPYGSAGDRLWVRESHHIEPLERIVYRADKTMMHIVDVPDEIIPSSACYLPTNFDAKWRPSIHMPRWASRITLEIISIRVEQLREVSVTDAIAEGCPWPKTDARAKNTDPRYWFSVLWDSINAKKHPWESNPWVWVVEFKRC